MVLDENPEEVLALTNMDERGRPGYKAEVVEVLPAEVLTDLIAPRTARHGAYNVVLIRAMSSDAFQRTVYGNPRPGQIIPSCAPRCRGSGWRRWRPCTTR